MSSWVKYNKHDKQHAGKSQEYSHRRDASIQVRMLLQNTISRSRAADSALGPNLTIVCDTLLCHNMRMPSVNIRQLRDTRRLKAWLRAGKTVELRERDTLIAKIVPEKRDSPKPAKWPDFEARAKEIFGDRVLDAVGDFLKDRGRY